MSSPGGADEDELPYAAQYAVSGRSKCKACKQSIEKGKLRIGTRVVIHDHSSLQWKCWPCWKVPRNLQTLEDIEGFQALEQADRDGIRQRVSQRDASQKVTSRKRAGIGQSTLSAWAGVTPPSAPARARAASTSSGGGGGAAAAAGGGASAGPGKPPEFAEFQQLCDKIEAKSGYLDKTAVVRAALPEWGDAHLLLLVRMLLPANDKRLYNLKDKGLVKVLSRVFGADAGAMSDHLDSCGDVSLTAAKYFSAKGGAKFSSGSGGGKGPILLEEVDTLLDELSVLTKEDEQVAAFSRFIRDGRAQPPDLKWLCRLIKKDLRTKCKDKHVLEAVHPQAYSMFKQNNDLALIVGEVLSHGAAAAGGGAGSDGGARASKKLRAGIALQQPIKPMLANPLKDLNAVFSKCPDGMYAEIKYDGERVQVHKDGDDCPTPSASRSHLFDSVLAKVGLTELCALRAQSCTTRARSSRCRRTRSRTSRTTCRRPARARAPSSSTRRSSWWTSRARCSRCAHRLASQQSSFGSSQQ